MPDTQPFVQYGELLITATAIAVPALFVSALAVAGATKVGVRYASYALARQVFALACLAMFAGCIGVFFIFLIVDRIIQSQPH